MPACGLTRLSYKAVFILRHCQRDGGVYIAPLQAQAKESQGKGVGLMPERDKYSGVCMNEIQID